MAGPRTTVALVALAAVALPVDLWAWGPSGAPQPPAAPAPPSDAELPAQQRTLRREVDRLTVAVSSARHLPFRGPLAVRAVSRDGGGGPLAGALAAGLASGALATDEAVLKRLGLLPPDAEYVALLAARYGTGAVPGYDPEARRLLVPESVPLEQQRLPLTHEIAHAVEDQRFGLARFLRVDEEGRWLLSGDALRARLAVVEGDATLTALEVADPRETFLSAHQRAALADQLGAQLRAGPARWFADNARFTYVDGFLFVARVRARQAWSAVDELWNDPPASTEQVLHPEKYDACEAPIAVDEALLPALPELGRPKSTDVLGEMMIRAWLGVSAPPELAARAAAGWGGDRAGIYAASAPDAGAANGGDARALPPMVWLTLWDDAGEADDFAGAAAGAFGDPAVRRHDEAVALAFGLAPDDARAALEQTLDGWARQARLSRRAGSRPRRGAPTGCPRRDRAAGPP